MDGWLTEYEDSDRDSVEKMWNYESLRDLCKSGFMTYCAGIAVATKLARLDDIDELMECPCTDLVKQLLEKPYDYNLGVLVGVLCRKAFKEGAQACKKPEVGKCENTVPEVLKRAEEVKKTLEEKGGRITQIVCEEDLVHITSDYGCGKAIITVYADGWEVAQAEGVVVHDDLTVVCAKQPPYMPNWLKKLDEVRKSA